MYHTLTLINSTLYMLVSHPILYYPVIATDLWMRKPQKCKTICIYRMSHHVHFARHVITYVLVALHNIDLRGTIDLLTKKRNSCSML